MAPATVVLPWMISGTRAPLHQGSSSLDGRLPAWCSSPIPLFAHEQDFTGHHNTEPLRVVFLLVAQPLHCRQAIALNITDSANKAIGNSRKNPKKCERAIVLFSVEIARQSRISSRSAWPQPPTTQTMGFTWLSKPSAQNAATTTKLKRCNSGMCMRRGLMRMIQYPIDCGST
ncbi:hypothetical protein CDC45_21480 (plasmid) [Ralstonia pseudosolanacearum]|uniref:Uncharacterized protein n=1 Tax=Ralstonia nicotianae (strain ATCC BAA-1114 / GMI1000) TaxID=267608 RepID=Q8XRQ7_RALN1|nr:hypothetical protein CDC45_21480 [Ralstonia pseudosolanacearum]CAD17925.1 hypothetical protein RSp0774 [Ralstonia pseudosolanacearum GMI1000]